MKTKLLSILILFYFQISFGQWENLDTGINDDLTGIVFFENNGLVSGHKGLYFTTNYGIGSSNWTRFNITDNNTNSTIYENTKFTHCYTNPSISGNTGVVFACGQNTASNKAIIIKINIPSMAYEFIYIGDNGSSLNQMAYSSYYNKYYAVGNNGLYLSFTETDYTIISTTMNDDLLSIDFDYSGSIIGSNNKAFTTELPNRGDSFSIRDTPGAIHKDVIDQGGTRYSVGNHYTKMSSTLNTFYDFYSFGELNGQAIIKKDNVHLVGTDHGIFKSNTSSTYLEWQPSSSKNSINSFWDEFNNSSLIYACGNNGVILKSENLGGVTKPHVIISAFGTCVGNYINIKSFTGSSINCNYYADGVKIKSGCTSTFSYKFDELGAHDISIVGINSDGEESTYTKTIYIVNPPEIDKTINILDNILCKEQPLEIEIVNSQDNIQYTLRKEESNEIFGTSTIGNGSNLTFTSIPLETGDYYISAAHTLANCTLRFSENFHVEVEHTEAIFFQSLINAKRNEIVGLYSHSIDAQNFAWDISPNSNPSSSDLENPQATFASLGETTVNLESWSDNGCYDEVTLPGPYIYQDLGHTEDSWSLINGGTDPSWEGAYFEDIGNMSPLQDGFLVCGYNSNSSLNSKIGVSHTFQNFAGGYAAKYDRNGVLKWVVYTKHRTSVGYRDREEIHFGVEDNEGNIYITGDSKTSFFDSTGSEINIDTDHVSVAENFIIKLNPSGKIIWTMQFKGSYFKKLFIDKKNNLIATGFSKFGQKNDIYLNGILSDAIGDTGTELPTSFPYTPHIIAKFTPEGSVLWDTPILIHNTNGSDIVDVGFDSLNNIYTTGFFEHRAEFYSAGSTNNETILGILNNYGGKLFLAKYDEDGQLQWKLRSITYNVSNDTTKPYSMVTDEDGNCYISGRNSVNGTVLALSSDYIHTFENTNGTLTQERIGSFFVSKIDSNGICEWIRGGAKSYYGIGYNVIKNGEEICVLGKISDRVEPSTEATFNGSDGKGIVLNISKVDYFIAIYDTSGNLKRIIQNGKNDPNVSGLSIFHDEVSSFFKGEGKNYYLSSNFGFYDFTSPGYNNFNHVIPTSNGTDGIITRFTEDSGIIYYPESLSTNKVNSDLTKYIVHPNPTKDILYITGKSQIIKLEVYNNLGQVVLSVFNEKSINISSLNSGVYFIKIEDKNYYTETKKFVKK